MTDFLEYFALQNTNSTPQLRDLTLLDLHQRPLREQNTGVRTENHAEYEHLLSSQLHSHRDSGAETRSPNPSRSVIDRQKTRTETHDSTPPSRISSAPDSLRTLALATNTRPSEIRSLDPAAESENNTATDVATTHLGSQQLRIVPVQLHRLECLQDRQTFTLLVRDIPSSEQHLLRSLAFLSRDEMETGREERRGETNFVSNFQIDASPVLQQQRDDSGMTPEASEMETSISILREMREIRDRQLSHYSDDLSRLPSRSKTRPPQYDLCHRPRSEESLHSKRDERRSGTGNSHIRLMIYRCSLLDQ
jgi:hypothetical protein